MRCTLHPKVKLQKHTNRHSQRFFAAFRHSCRGHCPCPVWSAARGIGEPLIAAVVLSAFIVGIAWVGARARDKSETSIACRLCVSVATSGQSRRLSGKLTGPFATGGFISMVVKINPERVAPAAIRNEQTPINNIMRNVGDGEWAISSKRWRLVTITANASNAPSIAPIAVWTIT